MAQRKRKQRIALKLRRDKSTNRWLLKYGRLNKDGEIGWAKKEWKIGSRGTSQLPKPVFFTLQSIIFRHLKKVEGDKNYDTMKPKIMVALSEAAIECGCKFEQKNGRLNWLLDDKRLLALTVLNFAKHGNAKPGVLAEQLRERKENFRRMEQKSRARLRAAIVVLKGGLWKLVPAKTRED